MSGQELHNHLKNNSHTSDIQDILMLYKESDGYVFFGVHQGKIGVGHLNVPLSMINNLDILKNIQSEIYSNIILTSGTNLFNVYDNNVAYRI